MTEQSQEMTLEQAIESIRISLAKGDEIMKSKTWSGGGFKSKAVRLLLTAVEKDNG